MLPPRTLALACLLLLAPLPAVAVSAPFALQEFSVAPEVWCEIRDEWLEGIHASHPAGTWAPMRFEPTDDQLRRLGLPPAEVLREARFEAPTLVTPEGARVALDPAGLASYAGAGCFGIRPGALLLTVTDEAIGWCTMAHAYGAPGSYQISTAGHCGKVGDVATVVAGIGSRDGVEGVVLLDFGKYAKSVDNGLGNDWALISVEARWQHLVSPTMCQWGGPVGMYTKTGDTVAVSARRLPPSVSTNADPLLVQTIVHYGHGLGVGFPIGTARAAEVIAWRASHFMFTGAISPGDSGSGSNTLGGDTLGAAREAAGINTHLWVDPLLRDGVGIMGGTRATQVQATLADGQLAPYPMPLAGAP